MSSLTLGLPARKMESALEWGKDFLQILCASLFIAFCGRLEIPLFFSPVPLTLQTLAILMTGACLGTRKGVLSVLLFIGEGCLGLPVFMHGMGGFTHLFGPTGGYILGFIPQVALAGVLAGRKMDRAATGAILIAACAVNLLMGALFLAPFVGFGKVVLKGILPFVPGDILKSLAVARFVK